MSQHSETKKMTVSIQVRATTEEKRDSIEQTFQKNAD